MTAPDTVTFDATPDEAAISGRKRKRSTSPTPSPAITTATVITNATAPAPVDLPANDPSTASPTTTTLSKNQQKKLIKKQKWEESRESRRAFRREKMAAKRARQRDARLAAQSTSSPQPETASTRRRNIHKLERQSHQLPITCIVDCSFDDYMTDKEATSLASQVSRCYSDNRIAPFSMNLHATCVDKRLRAHLDLMHGDKWHQWRRITVTDSDYTVASEDVAAGNIVYLSADSDETLETLDEGKTYIVGGIVDKNRHKGLCFNKAVAQGLRTAKLPIGEYIKMTGRITLTTNQVVEIMLRWLELRDWKLAFEKAIPMRKQKGHKPGKGQTTDAGEAKDGEAQYEVDVDVNVDDLTDDETENPPMNLDDEEDDDDDGEEGKEADEIEATSPPRASVSNES
ncbi:tRNA (guanine(9)-N(1))-methyltransferase [Orbilia brochopaga]|uniref:tRNA (guanine(9)-N1)-methyltransferase n=1 Tax=Orbilia brochopaga TaxID=3140254 RepID=A0AAV9VEW5_9PEZI